MRRQDRHAGGGHRASHDFRYRLHARHWRTDGATPPVVLANFNLTSGAQITGTVKNTSNTPLQNIFAQVYNSSGTFLTSVSTTSSGVFNLGGLQTGSYYVRTSNSQGFVDQV